MTTEYTASKNASPTTLSDEDFTTSADVLGEDDGWPFDIDRYLSGVDLEAQVTETNEENTSE